MNRKGKKEYLAGYLSIIVLIVLDQLTKFLAVLNLKDGNSFEILPGVFELRYLENQSAAFGVDLISIIHRIFSIKAFEENPNLFINCKMIFFTLLTVIVVILLLVLYNRIPKDRRFLFMDFTLILFVAGAIGNLIDRVYNHYVVDFIYFKAINFPIFNVADIYVTIAAFSFIVLGLFYYKEEDYEVIIPSKKKDE